LDTKFGVLVNDVTDLNFKAELNHSTNDQRKITISQKQEKRVGWTVPIVDCFDRDKFRPVVTLSWVLTGKKQVSMTLQGT